MCTIVILRHVHPGYPLVLAANRDELYARPAAGPQVLSLAPRVVGGRDLERQGTWMGVTEDGLFVGLTNQRGAVNLTRAPRSRGEVVMHALQSGGVGGVDRYLAGLDPREYNPFNLLYGDAGVLRVAYARPDSERVRQEDVPPGVHVLPNDVLDTPALPKVARARKLAEKAARKPWPEAVQVLQAMLADHLLPEHMPELLLEEEGLPEMSERIRQYQALCIHTPGYGTRSSAIVALAPGRVAHYLTSDVAPCHGTYQDVTPLLQPR
ncbi:NRDE family protein [Archangium sp.]|uniref:NRDE family protein n=1 Tax=Archangium sp. TaxID=1872627 RepID=UPI002D269EB1|nr:NRDE family protein [Archangium sp.]HYO54368.1 NRDE family protein [Archangium sp.]